MSFTSQSLLAKYLKKQKDLKDPSISRVYVEREKVIVEYSSYFSENLYYDTWETPFTTIDELMNALILGVEPEKQNAYYNYQRFDD